MKNIIIIIFILSFGLRSQAQNIKFLFMYKEELFKLDTEYKYKDQLITFSKFKFYVSNLQYLKKDIVVKQLNRSYLLDASQSSVKILETKTDSFVFDKIKFKIGVDSIKSVSGAMSGDLDPTNGMYWSWQSGYINCKIEGSTPICPSRKNKFQFHLGGYAYPYNSLQEYSVTFTDTTEQVIEIAMDKFIQAINLKKEYKIMSPSKRAVELSQLFSSVFRNEE